MHDESVVGSCWKLIRCDARASGYVVGSHKSDDTIRNRSGVGDASKSLDMNPRWAGRHWSYRVALDSTIVSSDGRMAGWLF